MSFALTEEAVCEAHAATSGGEDEVVEPDVEVSGVDSHPERTAAAQEAAAERHESLSRKREDGKKRQAAAAAAKRAPPKRAPTE